MAKNIILHSMFVLTFLFGFVEVLAVLKGSEVSSSTYSLWSIVFILLTVCWVDQDSRFGDFDRPFELGFLILVFWPVTLPWYLLSTRGSEGVLTILGLVTLYVGPWVAGLVTYVYFT